MITKTAKHYYFLYVILCITASRETLYVKWWVHNEHAIDNLYVALQNREVSNRKNILDKMWVCVSIDEWVWMKVCDCMYGNFKIWKRANQ